MIYNVVEGSTFSAANEFLDEEGNPLQPKPGYPRVRLYDSQDDVVFDLVANFVSLGNYSLNAPLPIFDYKEKKQLRLVWVFRDAENTKYKTTDVVFVEPLSSKRETDLFTISGKDTKAAFVISDSLVDSEISIDLYFQNSLLSSPTFSSTTNGIDKTNVVLTLPQLSAKLENYLLICTVNKASTNLSKNYTYKLWNVTPSIVSQISLIDDFVNKSKIENAIPELEYTPSDTMSALINGLSHFNGIGPQLTSFNGLNMQGPIGNAWFLCSCWYLIQAQKLAEGSLAFDFSGQGVSLNVDRTPHLDALLGSLDSRIQDTVVPLKKLLAKAGVVAGDGSQGSNLNGIANSRSAASRLGNLTVINAPTTRFTKGLRYQLG